MRFFWHFFEDFWDFSEDFWDFIKDFSDSLGFSEFMGVSRHLFLFFLQTSFFQIHGVDFFKYLCTKICFRYRALDPGKLSIRFFGLVCFWIYFASDPPLVWNSRSAHTPKHTHSQTDTHTDTHINPQHPHSDALPVSAPFIHFR